MRGRCRNGTPSPKSRSCAGMTRGRANCLPGSGVCRCSSTRPNRGSSAVPSREPRRPKPDGGGPARCWSPSPPARSAGTAQQGTRSKQNSTSSFTNTRGGPALGRQHRQRLLAVQPHRRDLAARPGPCCPPRSTRNSRASTYITCANSIGLTNATLTQGQFQNGFPMLAYMLGIHNYRCCPHNYGMGWPYYAQELWFGTWDNGLCASMYGASQVTAKVGAGGTTVTIVEDTDY